MNSLQYLTFDLKEDVSANSSKRILFGILLLAVVLRLWGIWHGYPYSYYSDEEHFVKRALSFGSGDFNPHWFHKPAFYMYLLFFEYGLFYLIGKMSGFFHSVNDFAVFYIKNPGPFYVIGRATTTMFSVGSIVFCYLSASQLINRKAGLLSALVLTLSFGHVMVAKDVKADTPCMFFTIVSAYYLVCYMKDRRTKDIIVSAVFAGIGTATKYYSMVMLIPIFIALMTNFTAWNMKSISHGLKIFSLCVFSFFFIYFVCSPFNFIDPLGRKSTFSKINNLTTKINSTMFHLDGPIDKKINSPQNTHHATRNHLSFVEGFKKYVFELHKGMGYVIWLTLLIGLILVITNSNRMIFIFFLLPLVVAMVSIFLYPGYAQIRHQVILYPFLVLCSGVFFTKILDLLTVHKKFGYSFLIILIIPLYYIINFNIYISQDDSRNLAKAWIEAEIPSGSKILIDENGPRLNLSEKQIRKMLDKAHLANPEGQFTAHFGKYLEYQLIAVQNAISYDLHEIRFPWWRNFETNSGIQMLASERDKDMGNPLRPVGVEKYDYYIKNGFDYAIVISESYHRFFLNNQVSRNFPSFAKFYQDLFERGILVKEFSHENIQMQGPVVRIFKFR